MSRTTKALIIFVLYATGIAISYYYGPKAMDHIKNQQEKHMDRLEKMLIIGIVVIMTSLVFANFYSSYGTGHLVKQVSDTIKIYNEK